MPFISTMNPPLTPPRRGTVRTRTIVCAPLGLATVHWDHEPRAVPRPTESADKSDALQTLRALRRRPAVAKRLECVRLQRRFPKPGYDSMTGQVHGEPSFVLRMHWDHEHTMRNLFICKRTFLRFMESLQGFNPVHGDHECRTSEALRPTCCRQDAGSTLG